ncbi:MAG: hypothetical protein NTV51_20005 [Verrucomicrobia bacterium]|nr:hypothetical protein [Verrucomicrobiota bacterium]
MKTESSLERLIGWRAAEAEADAPPAPRAGRLLEHARPWWQRQPERLRALASALEGMHARFGHAMEPEGGRGGSHPVPAVIARTNVETNSLADILYLNLRGRTLRLRFLLRAPSASAEPAMEVTFVAPDGPQALFAAVATQTPAGEYRLELELPDAVAQAWAHLRVTDRMPFRFILRPDDGA